MEILLYQDCDVTKDIENVNKKWDAKILGVTKAYEKKNVFLKLRKNDAYLSIKLHHHQTLQPTISTNIWKVLQTRHPTVKNKLEMSRQLIEKLTYKKIGSSTNETSREKIQTKTINLSKSHLTKFQISSLKAGPKICLTTKRKCV